MPRTLGAMTSPAIDRVQAALARVNDPEIKRPITELGMVENIDIDDTGWSRSRCCSPSPAAR